MLIFLAKTKNLRNTRSEHPIYNRGKVLEKAAGKYLKKQREIAIRNFQIQNKRE